MKHFLLTGGTVVGLAVAIIASQSSDSARQSVPVAKIPAAFGAIHPRISPDGESIAFSYQGAIWRVPRAGGTMTRLTAGTGFDTEPAWSPDGKQIAYVTSAGFGGGPLRMVDAKNGSAVRLAENISAGRTYVVFKVDFHPDGRRVVGGLSRNGQDLGIALFDLQTGNVQTLVKPPRSSRYRYALSNSGDRVAYTTSMDVAGQQGGNNGPQADIWQVSTKGGEPRKITRFPCRIHDLAWSHDDTALFVVTELGGVHYDLWRVPLDDNPLRSARKITMGQADETRPSVSRDGRWLVYSDNRDGTTAIVVRDLRDHTEQTLTVTGMNYRKPAGSLRLRTIDKKSSRPPGADRLLVARVSIEQENGKYFAPAGSLYRVLKNYGHFYCNKECRLTLPTGKYQLRVLRGPEYRPAYHNFKIAPDITTELDVELERWIHNAERGWYSGENHIHANYGYGEWYNTPQSMLEQCSGENLNVCNFMVANSDTDGVFDREFFRGRPDPLSTDETLLYWNQEFRSTIWGHMTLVNLSQVVEPIFTGFKDTTNPWDIPTNSDIADRTHLQNGLVNYTHVAQRPEDPYQNPYTGKSIPVDVALGKIDSLDLNASYAGTVPLWHRLLNCGFHLPASAGTDCFLNRVRSRLPGGDRVYVKVDGAFSYSKWIDGLRAGRTFVTNGPMLELSVADKGIGETIRLAQAGDVMIEAIARSQFPMAKVELIYNGKVIATAPLNVPRLRGTISQRVTLQRSGWLALRATGPGHIDHPLGSQSAHTSPVYVEIAGKPAASRTDAEFFLKWIDRLELAIRLRDRIPSDELRRHVRDQLEAARAVYRGIADTAK